MFLRVGRLSEIILRSTAVDEVVVLSLLGLALRDLERDLEKDLERGLFRDFLDYDLGREP